MTFEEVGVLLDNVHYKGWNFRLRLRRGVPYLQVSFLAEDTVTRKVTAHTGRKWMLTEHMTKSEIVLTAFKAVLTAEEHEVRESFKYVGRAIFNPHIDVDKLHFVCDEVDARPRGDE